MTTTKKPKKAAPRKIKVVDDDEWVEREPKRRIPGVRGGPPPSTEPKPAKPAKAKAEPKEKPMSALDAAFQVLAKSKEPMAAKAIVEAMAADGLWTSGKGKTPHATLYSAMVREIAAKGDDSRFKRVETKFSINKSR